MKLFTVVKGELKTYKTSIETKDGLVEWTVQASNKDEAKAKLEAKYLAKFKRKKPLKVEEVENNTSKSTSGGHKIPTRGRKPRH